MNKKGIFAALLASLFYALNAPCSKFLLETIPPTLLAGILYIGAGVGMSLIYIFTRKSKQAAKTPLSSKDSKYVIGMILLDVVAPISLLMGLRLSTASNVSLLNNFEIVATAIIAFTLFRERISGKLWISISLVTLSSILLSMNEMGSLLSPASLQLSYGSLLVLLACICWGFENNCTKRLSTKNPVQIVMMKGLCSGFVSLLIGIFIGEQLEVSQSLLTILFALLLGFVAYGLSIYFYILAQRYLGASKTSTYYACAPFIGAFISILFFHETPSLLFCLATIIMLIGSIIASKAQ